MCTCNLPFSFLSVTCSPPLADLFFVCSLVAIEDIFSVWFHSISQQHLKGVMIALHLKSAFRRVSIVILTTLYHFFLLLPIPMFYFKYFALI